ncbi:Chalcone synthase [Rhynchospora pubera]|uniref:chalcone synthase n=1 Tax=Rhynchospora pubera TaxID=906938 RepID=A0AAV8D168_9POAL|nr:Chalcone synthase [Rhynchospora pubera]
MNLKLILTVRSASGISRTGEDTDCRAQATVLAVGTAVPQNYIYQSDYPDYYFRVTNSRHLGDLKEKFTRICKATEIRKRYFHLTDEMIQDHPNIAGHNENSLDARNNLLRANIPELGKEAADKALQEWGQSSDGAAAVIVGSEPEFSVEEPHFEIVSANQTLIPGTADAISGCVTEVGLYGSLSPDVPRHIANGIGKCISDAFAPLEITDWNSLFWIVHPGGRKILDDVEGALKLEKDKFFVSRRVLAEYGNVASASVFFVMDEMRRRSKKEGKATTGEGKGLGHVALVSLLRLLSFVPSQSPTDVSHVALTLLLVSLHFANII